LALLLEQSVCSLRTYAFERQKEKVSVVELAEWITDEDKNLLVQLTQNGTDILVRVTLTGSIRWRAWRGQA
jgi:hypothetical protein